MKEAQTPIIPAAPGTAGPPGTAAEGGLFQPLTDPAAFGRAVGYGKLTGLHSEWMRKMLFTPEDLTLQAHRGSYKTTCLCIVMALLMVVRSDENIIFLRKTDHDVTEVIRQVTRILKSEALQKAALSYYGKPLQILRSTQSEITTSYYTGAGGMSQLLGCGIGGSLTGKHADLVVTDDIVNLKDRLSEAERERTRECYQELQNIKNRTGRIINTGTPWHKDDCFALMPRPERYDCYSTGLIRPQELQKLKESMNASLFCANYELKHIADEDAMFGRPPPMTGEEALLYGGMAHIDAAYGGGDHTALTLGNRAGQKYCLYGRLWPSHVQNVLPEILSLCERLQCAPILCETNADKGYLGREIRAMGGCAKMYTETQNKYYKIATFLKKHWADTVFLEGTDPEYLDQIEGYNLHSTRDDAPDSAASLLRVLERTEE